MHFTGRYTYLPKINTYRSIYTKIMNNLLIRQSFSIRKHLCTRHAISRFKLLSFSVHSGILTCDCLGFYYSNLLVLGLWSSLE